MDNKNSLEWNLITNRQHDDAILALTVIEDFGQAKVITCINYKVAEFVRQTKGNGEVEFLESLTIAVFNISKSSFILCLLRNQESRLDTGLNGQSWCYIVVCHDGHIDVCHGY